MRELRVTAWFTGRRRDQSSSRRQMPILELDAQGRLKINTPGQLEPQTSLDLYL